MSTSRPRGGGPLNATSIALAIGRRIPVAIVEDEENDCWLIKRALEQTREFHFLNSYSSGEAALSGIPQSLAKVVLMDIRMPGMSGTECLRRLKAANPEIMVIMVTAFDDPPAIAAALAAGADHCLIKPLCACQLLVTVVFLLNLSAGASPAYGDLYSAQRAPTARHENTGRLAAVLAGCLGRARRCGCRPTGPPRNGLKKWKPRQPCPRSEQDVTMTHLAVFRRTLSSISEHWRK